MTEEAPPAPAPAWESGAFDDHGHYLPVGTQLRLLRERAGLSQRALAEATARVAAEEQREARREYREPRWTKGLGAFTIARYESGFHSPTARSVALLARTLGDALSVAEGAPVVVTPEDLRTKDAPGLAAFLAGEIGDGDPGAFWGRLRIKPARGEALLTGDAPWTADELGAVALAFPLAANAARDVMIDQARRRRGLPALRRWGARDRANPDRRDP